jgi:asparagine synthase (glutamine-hydrolysing)
MCGLCGLIGEQHQAQIEAATQKIAHRGPDDMGIFSDEHISLGHRRLSIQDLSENGHQPMVDASGRYVLVFNGEVYNHMDIRAKLVNRFEFKSHSDTETILYGFIAFGTELFNMLNGIFAFSIYDKETSELTLVRDQFGVKPVYYSAGPSFFYFASESKSFVNLPEVNKTPDVEALFNYLHFLWSPGERTAIRGVKKLLPGHFIKVQCRDFEESKGSVVPVKYYEIPFDGSRTDATEAELIDELEARLTNAVRRQLLSDVPLGFFLSGGLDSSAVVALAKKAMPNARLKCYTIDYGENEADGVVSDLSYAKHVANYLDVDLEIVAGEKDILSSYDKMIYHLDEPQTDIAPIHVRNICKAARADGRVVLLGGTAGDDLFSGYRRHQALKYERLVAFLPQFIRSGLQKLSKPIGRGKTAFHRRLSKALRNIHLNDQERMAAYYGWIDPALSVTLFSKQYCERLKQLSPNESLLSSLKNIPEELDQLNQMLYWDLKYFLVDHNLNYTDKLGMAEGVEVRVPFLDKELLEFSTTLPTSLKLKGQTTKYIFKKMMERYLPHDVIYRPKSGFGGPVRQWINKDYIEWVDITLSQEKIQKIGIFDYHAVRKLVLDSRSGMLDGAYTVLSIIGVQSYFDQIKIDDNEDIG